MNDAITKEMKNVHYEKKMSLKEIHGNVIGFMVAGYETTSSTLNYCMYVLARHPEELKKLQNELDKAVPSKDVRYCLKLHIFL